MPTPIAGSRLRRTAGNAFVGRDQAIGQLATFLYDPARRRTGIVFLTGQPGSGKSALAEHVLALRPPQDWAVSFKFDQYLNAAPARFFVAALTKLGAAILALDEPERTDLCRRLVDAVSPNGQVLLDLCPALEPVLGAQLPAIELGPLENQIRLSLVLRRFFQALAGPNRRLLLFIDDLQWADGATMRVLGDLLVDPQIVGLSVIVASRQGQDDNPRKLRRALNVLGNPTLDINLDGLSRAAIGELIGRRADLSAEAESSLAERIGAATDGNPLAVVNVITLMMERGVIRRASDGGGDQFSPEAAQGLLGNSAVDALMRSRIDAMDPPLQDLLAVAANVGDTFDLPLLAELTGTPALVLKATAETLVREEILVPVAGDRQGLRFAHDKLQEAARAIWAEAHGDPAPLHLAAARGFAARWQAGGDTDCLFRAVRLFERAEPLLDDPVERGRLALQAATAVRLALDSGDPAAGLAFARFGLRLRPADAWDTAHDPMREAVLDAAEAAYLAGDLRALEAFTDEAARHARTGLEWAAANRTRLRQKLGAMEYEPALDIAVAMLDRLEAPLPRRVNGAQVGAAFAATAWALKGRSMDDLFHLPHMIDPRAEAELETLMFASSAAYFAQPNLFALIVFRMVRLSLAAGNSALSAFGWVCYGLAQCAVVGNFRSGHAYGQLGLRLVEEFGAEELRARIHMLFSVFVRQWSEGRAGVAAHLLQGEEAGIASGDLEFATYCTWHRINDGFWAGAPLERIAPEIEDSRIVCLGYHQSKVAFLLGMMGAFVTWATVPGAPEPDDAAHEAYCRERQDFTSLCYVKLYQALRHAVAGNPHASLAATTEIVASFASLQGQFYVPHFVYLRTHAAAMLAATERNERGVHLRLARAGARQLARWAAKGTQAAAPLATLAAGLALWAQGRTLEAMRTLEAALAAEGPEAAPLPMRMLAARVLAEVHAAAGLTRTALGTRQDADEIAAVWQCRRTGRWSPAGNLPARRNGVGALLAGADADPARGAAPDLAALVATERIFEAVGGNGILLLLEEDDRSTRLLRSLRTDSATPTPDLRAVPADAVELALLAAATGPRPDPGRGDLLHVAMPQPDGSVAHLLVTGASGTRTAATAAHLSGLIGPLVGGLRLADLRRRVREVEAHNVELSTAHGRFVPGYLLRELGRNEITELRVGDHAARTMTVMFCDMRGATGIMERIGPQGSMELFNEVFIGIESEVLRGGGHIDSFIGDAVLALFGGPADDALATLQAVSQTLGRVQTRIRARGLPAPRFGLGMSTGEVVFGAVGGLNQIRVGAIRDTLNLAARVESLTKRYRTAALITQHLRDALARPEDVTLRQVDFVTVFGRRDPVRLFEVVDALPPDRAAATRAILEPYRDGLEAFYARDFVTAAEAFRVCVAALPDDVPSRLFLSRCETYIRSGVGPGWTGIHKLKQK